MVVIIGSVKCLCRTAGLHMAQVLPRDLLWRLRQSVELFALTPHLWAWAASDSARTSFFADTPNDGIFADLGNFVSHV